MFLHQHKYIPKEIRYPILIRVQINERNEPYQDVSRDGTAILYKCSCGDARVNQMLGRREIWHDSIIEVEE
jgi:hypothetical protein